MKGIINVTARTLTCERQEGATSCNTTDISLVGHSEVYASFPLECCPDLTVAGDPVPVHLFLQNSQQGKHRCFPIQLGPDLTLTCEKRKQVRIWAMTYAKLRVS